MTPDEDERIRQRAYELWEREGCPEGKEFDHWMQAKMDVASEDSPLTEPMQSSPGIGDDGVGENGLEAETNPARSVQAASLKKPRPRRSKATT